MARVELHGVTRDSDGTQILDRVTVAVDDGEFVGLIGPSGSGKTSILRIVAGFDHPSSGTLRFDGDDVTSTSTRDRDISFVSQHDTLFPTHRVRKNLWFPLRVRSIPRGEARKRVLAESRAHGIEHILERWPASLSGGEQQLAQIARALVRVPKVLLMDEPLAQLDVRVRRHMRKELVELQRGYGVTTMYASNTPEEILTMPDRLVGLDHGRIVQTGTPTEVRLGPATLSIAELTGAIGRLDVTVEPGDEGFWITGDGVRLRAWAPALGRWIGEPITLAVRAEHVRLTTGGPITMTAGSKTFVESRTAVVLRSGAGSIHCFDTGIAPETKVSVTLDRWLLFDSTGERVASFPA